MPDEKMRRVLIVEDSPAMRQLLAMSVRRAGGEVTEAPDGLAALKELAQHRFDLIFVDLNMPVMDGLKLIRRVRDDPQHAQTTICVCTTESSVSTDEQCMSLGANHVLHKPTSRREIDMILARAFQR